MSIFFNVLTFSRFIAQPCIYSYQWAVSRQRKIRVVSSGVWYHVVW